MLTALGSDSYGGYLESIKPYAVPILAVWTTRLSIAGGDLKRMTDKVPEEFKRFAVEDLHFLDTQPLEILGEIPLLYVGLTWNYDNALAGGAKGTGGLSAKGRSVIRMAERLGVAVDTAHLNRKSFFETVDFAEGKLLCSHCCFDSVFNHVRNLSDEQIGLIKGRGGIVGMTLESSFLSDGKARLCDAVRHIDYFVSKFGLGSLALGTDFNGCTPPDELSDYRSLEKLGYELEKLGYTKENIRKIFYENANNFFTVR